MKKFKMEQFNLMERGKDYVLCGNCQNITVRDFFKCHKCKTSINNRDYKQASNMEKYPLLIKALMAFQIDVLEDCHSMISIHVDPIKGYAPELYQIYKRNNEYTYVHLEQDTHKTLEELIIDPKSFVPKLSPNRIYKIELVYGPHIIYIYQ